MTTMRAGSTCTPKRCAYHCEMRSRSGARPVASVYCVRPSRSARSAASRTSGAAVKSGSPMFRKIIGRSAHSGERASSAAALAHSIT